MSTREFPATHPSIFWKGRHVASAEGVRIGWPLAEGTLRFQGTGIHLELSGPGNRVAVWCDGAIQEIRLVNATDTVHITGLAPGEHEIRWGRRNQENWMDVLCRRVFVENGDLRPPAPRRNRILWVGDSWSAGYGNQCPGNCPDTEADILEHTDSYSAFPALASIMLGFDPEVVAVSGRGIVKNFGDRPPSKDPLGSYFDLALPMHGAPRWIEPQGLSPLLHMVLLAGANDYTAEPHPQLDDFVSGYQDLCRRMKQAHPKAQLWCGIPAGRPHLIPVQQALQSMPKELGAKPLQVPAVDETYPWGCRYHPGELHHVMLAKAAAEQIRQHDLVLCPT